MVDTVVELGIFVVGVEVEDDTLYLPLLQR